MPTTIKTYRAHGRTRTGASGFSNHQHGSREDIRRALDEVFADHPESVVLDGDDDWYAPGCNRPERFDTVFGVTPLALFHTKGSGISVSGIVVNREDFERIECEFPTKTWTQIGKPAQTGRSLRDCVTVYDSKESGR